jgi:hypothetical protein
MPSAQLQLLPVFGVARVFRERQLGRILRHQSRQVLIDESLQAGAIASGFGRPRADDEAYRSRAGDYALHLFTHPDGIPYGTFSNTASTRVILPFLILNNSPSRNVYGVSNGGPTLCSVPSVHFTLVIVPA